MPRLNIGDWFNDAVDWLIKNFAWLFDFITDVVTGTYDGLTWVLTGPNPFILMGILAVLAFWLRGLLAGVLSFVGFALIDAMDQWEESMQSLSLVLVASVIAIVIAVPLGIWAASKKSASSVIRPVLDLMQTMPAMVYVLIALGFFNLGTAPGVIATIIFAMPVGVRMTELGLRQVDKELVEAADAFGTTPRNTLIKVKLPLALPTIMAGLNQVIMLSLSMVVISGMVGVDGLGKTVYGAISNIQLGLGFEGGLAVVVLAVYLDRMTGALADQVSPLGRRALAKMQAAMQGINLMHWRPRPAIAGIGILVLALVGGGIGVFGSDDEDGAQPAAQSSNVGKGKDVNIGYFNWDESVATGLLWKEMLDQRGYKAKATSLDPGAAFKGLSTNQFDFITDAWLPTTHEPYMKQFGKNYTDLGKWYEKTSLEVAVPDYVKGVKTMEDLKGKSKQFGGRIIGIEPGAGEMKLLKEKVLPGYGLDKEYKLIDGSTAAMLSQLKKDYAAKKPVAVVLWTPHWAYGKYDMTKLADPKQLWGEGDSIHSLGHKSIGTKLPQVKKWMKNFSMSEADLAALENSINAAGKGKQQEGVRAWLQKNPDVMNKYVPVPNAGKVNLGKGAEVSIGGFNWDESIATSYLWEEVLEQRGFKPKTRLLDPGAAFKGLSTNQFDFITDAWLPTTHEPYMKQFGKNYTDLGKWYEKTSLEVAVPDYVKGVKTMEDLKGKSKQFGGRIIGIEPGAGEMKLLKEKVLPGYGLDKEYKLIDGSTAAMLSQLKKDYAAKKPVAVVLWSPHWAYGKYKMTKLADPKQFWGEGDSIHTLAHKSLAKKQPLVANWLKKFSMSEADLAALENSINAAGKGKQREGVRAWLKKHPGMVDRIAPAPAAASSAGSDSSAKAMAKERGKDLNIGYIPWDEGVAVTHLWKNVLQDKGYKPNVKQVDVGPMFKTMARGDLDVQFDGWLPTTQKTYWGTYKKDLVQVGAWYDKTSLEVTVPSYVKGVKTLADLKGKSKQFGGRIIGIEPGAGVMKAMKDKVLPGYGLDKEYKLIEGSTPAMLSQLKKDYAAKKPVAVLLWTPHWAYGKYELTKLKDPKGTFGTGDHIVTLANKSFPKKFPQLNTWFKNFKLSEDQLAQLEVSINDAGDGKVDEGVRAWMKKNPDVVKQMTS